IAGFLASAGKNVTLIARNQNLQAIRNHGFRIRKGDMERVIDLKVMTEEEYAEKADIIFLCVKGYSVEETYPLLQKAAGSHTIVIPILNIYGTGEKISRDLPGMQVLNGCIYISAAIEEPGVVRISSDIFRVVYGRVDGKKDEPILYQVEQDLKDAGITPLYTDQIQRDTLQKYTMVSPMAAVGAFYDVSCGKMQEPGEIRDKYIACIKEIESLAGAMGITFPVDVVETNVKILDDLPRECTASMQKDLKKGGKTEMDGLIFEMVRMGHKYGVPVPTYEEIAAKFGFSD
ncbi:MAG: ketopantoate reductase family protein, partial [Oliverpabstia sp.]